MNEHKERLNAFAKLGDFFTNYCDIIEKDKNENDISQWSNELDEIIDLAGHKNGWFTKENIRFSLKSWGKLLTETNLENWLEPYSIDQNKLKTVALIMAGNIPLVGFHDFLTVLLTGNNAIVKLSSNDSILLPFVARYLASIHPPIEHNIHFTENKLEHFDAVIATGSDNTARYFEHYFGNKPNIIRKNRNSVAILTGSESTDQFQALGEDIFRYYGLGCRSVSKLFVPKGYNFDSFFKAVFDYSDIVNQAKYANNYDYNKAVYLMSEFKLLDNGFLMLKEDKSYASPIATLFYEQFESIAILKKQLILEKDKIQCVVSDGVTDTEISFGQTQQPSLNDYADGIDTVEFLLKT